MTDEAKTDPKPKSRRSPNRIRSFRKQLKGYMLDYNLDGDQPIDDLLGKVEEDFLEYVDELE